jgi:hypothetical protein
MRRVEDPGAVFSRPQNGPEVYKEFDATELYCPKCKQLLLVLPEGDKYEYLCAYCSETVGTKMDKQDKPLTIIS